MTDASAVNNALNPETPARLPVARRDQDRRDHSQQETTTFLTGNAAAHALSERDLRAHPLSLLWGYDHGEVARTIGAAQGNFSQRTATIIDTAGRINHDVLCYFAHSTRGPAVALIPILGKNQQPLGDFDIGVAAPGQNSFQATSIQMSAIHGRLAVHDGSVYHFTHMQAGNLPPRVRMADEPGPSPAAVPATHRSTPERIEYRLPTGQTLSWDDGDRKNARKGAFAEGWQAQMSHAGGSQEVFVKVLRDHDAFEDIRHAEARLREWGLQNRALSELIPSSLLAIDHPAGSKPLGFAQGSAGLFIEPFHRGFTAKDISDGNWCVGDRHQGLPHLQTLAGIGKLAADTLIELNRGTGIGYRRFAPDFAKPDNLIITKFMVDPAHGHPVPTQLVCPDRDSFVDERDHSTSFRGNAYFLDLRTIAANHGSQLFDKVEALHVFSLGRMLLDTALPEGMRPKLPEQWDVNAFVEMHRLQNNAYRQGITAFNGYYGQTVLNLSGQFLELIRQCCHPEVERRPSLMRVKRVCNDLSLWAEPEPTRTVSLPNRSHRSLAFRDDTNPF